MDIKKLSQLARIKLSKEEQDSVSGELESVLGYVEKLKEVNVDGVGELTHALDVSNDLREDNVDLKEEGNPDDLIVASSHKKDGFIKIKKVLDGED